MNNPFIMVATRRFTNTKALLKRFFFLRVRLLPIVIFCATLLLSVKISTIWHHMSKGESPLGVRSVYAAPETPPAGGSATTTAQATAGSSAPSTAAPQAQKAPPAAQGAHGPDVNAPKASLSASEIDPMTLTPEALSTLLQIDQQKEHAPKKQGANAHEQAIQDVINKEIQERTHSLSQTRDELEKILSSVNQKESDNLKRVVQMVEGMKPKEAAQRLEAMDFDSLVAIMEKVKPQKAALILTNMEPVKAGYLMTELSKRRIILQEGGTPQSGAGAASSAATTSAAPSSANAPAASANASSAAAPPTVASPPAPASSASADHTPAPPAAASSAG